MRRAAVLLAIVAACASSVRGDDALKDEATLEKVEKSLGRSLAARHLSASKRIARHPREAFLELSLGLLLEPGDKAIREKLGFKKEGDAWAGEPLLPAWTEKDELSEAEKKLLDAEHRENAAKLVALAKRAKAGGLADAARRLAGLALEENPEDRAARELLGHVLREGAWLSPREASLCAAFAKALEAASSGVEKTSGGEELEKLVGLGALDRREAPHFVLTASKAAAADLAALAKNAEAARAAVRWFFDGDDSGFSIEGKKPPAKLEASSDALPFVAVFVDEKEHGPYCEHVVQDKSMVEHAKKTAGWPETVSLGSAKVDLEECCYEADYRREWLANAVAAATAAPHVTGVEPDFLDEGIRRFFGGHVSGRAELGYAGSGSQGGGGSSGREGSLQDVRLRARRVLRASFGGRLRSALQKTTDELDSDDSAVALAFVDLCLAQHREELVALLHEGKRDELFTVTAERVFDKKLDEVEREVQAWVRVEY